VDELSGRLRYYRRLSGLTQLEVSAHLNMSPKYIQHIEQGRRGISLGRLVDLCRLYQIGLSDLIPL